MLSEDKARGYFRDELKFPPGISFSKNQIDVILKVMSSAENKKSYSHPWENLEQDIQMEGLTCPPSMYHLHKEDLPPGSWSRTDVSFLCEISQRADNNLKNPILLEYFRDKRSLT